MRPDSQCARVLRVLADGKAHTVPEIHRKAGTMRLNSRVAELRGHGYDIACTLGAGKGAGRYRYQLVDLPADPPGFVVDAVSAALTIPTGWALEPDQYAPRDDRNRYHLYRLTDSDERELVATCPTPESVGVALVTLGSEGEFQRCAIGILDTAEDPGTWILNPWEARTR